MKKRIIFFLALALIISCFCTLGAAAAYEDGPSVRVNGRLVEFPDGQPFIDANDRTLIPVRFVAEELGADVSWDGKTRTAIIKRGGVEVDITIGNSVLTVKRDGATDKVTMDTEAVLAHDRTYVPIRFVAEQLGAFVDYADYYRTVGIYNDVLSKEEIERLSSYPLDAVDTNIEFLRGLDITVLEPTTTFADCRELEWRNPGGLRNPQKTLDNAISLLNYHSDNFDMEFRTDASCYYSNNAYCLYEGDDISADDPSVRGVLSITIKKLDTIDNVWPEKDREAGRYWSMLLVRSGFYKEHTLDLPEGETVILDVECKFCPYAFDKTFDTLLEMWILDDPGQHVGTK